MPVTATPSSVPSATLWKVWISASGSDAAHTAAAGPSSSSRSRPTTPSATQPSTCAGESSSSTASSACAASPKWSAERKRKARSTGAPASAAAASRAASRTASTASGETDNPAPTRRVSVSGLMGRSVRLAFGPSALASGRLAALAAGRLLLRGRAALGGVAAGAGLLAAAARGAGRVGDLGRALLGHPLVLEGLVLLLVLDVGLPAWHPRPPTASRSLRRARRSGCRPTRGRRRPA